MSENRFGKYFKYAIGEIFLVVIGILIALQINNWNEFRKQNIRSTEYHERISDDLSLLINQSDNLYEHASQILTSITRTVELLESGTLETDEDKQTVDYAMVWFSRTSYQLPELPTYVEMMSNGDINLIYDVNLRTDIANFNNFLKQVASVVLKLSNAIEVDFRVFNRHLRSHVDPVSLEVMYTYDFEKMASDKEFVNTFSRLAYHWRGYVYFIQRVNEDGTGLQSKVEARLDNTTKLHSPEIYSN